MRATHLTRHRVPLIGCALLLLATGCTSERDQTSAPTPPPTAASPDATVTTGPDTDLGPAPSAPGAGPTAGPGRTTAAPKPGPTGRVTYGWGVPSVPVLIRHTVPAMSPPAPSLPYLTKVEVGDHPAERYSRITFAFRGATPSYEIAYVPRVEAEGTGDPVALPGNAFLKIRFEQAQAHDGEGHSTIVTAAPKQIGYPSLLGYGFGGDFEGYLTYGLGLRVAPGSDQALPIRVLELTRSDGSRVVAVDVRYG